MQLLKQNGYTTDQFITLLFFVYIYIYIAVFVGNDTLYILFGADSNHQIVNDVHILNVTSMRWLDATANSTVDTGSGGQDSKANQDSSPSLSPGQIAGIVIGVVAGVSNG
jgi:hypothetical protein